MVLNAWKGHLLSRRQREQLYVVSSAVSAACLGLLLLLNRLEEGDLPLSPMATWFMALILCLVL